MAATNKPSVADRTRPIAAGAAVVGAYFLADTAVFVLGDEALLFVAGNGDPQRVVVHGGGILAAASDGERIVTAGDDGKVVATKVDMATATIAADPKHRWIDHVALAPDGTVGWSAGKDAFVQPRKGEPRKLEAPSTVGGLAFAPKGRRLAIAHYHGVTLWFPNAAEAAPERLEWKGSHLDVIFSPDGRYLVTAMQEPMLHGWRLVDGKHMRMSGYATKVRSLAWGPGAKWLATSGATQLVIWPFAGKDGPMGKTPKVVSPADHRISAVAAHPKQEVCAVGYEDGMMLLTRIEVGTEDGDAGVIPL